MSWWKRPGQLSLSQSLDIPPVENAAQRKKKRGTNKKNENMNG
jgi:hypothetical protein